MVWGRTDEAVGDQVDESEGQPVFLERNLDTVCRRRLSQSDCQHAHRDKRAILAAFVFLSVRTARHVPGHCGHIAHLGNGQPFCRRRRHQRRGNESDDHKDREQTSDESANIHNLTSHRAANLERTIRSHSCQMEKRARKHRKYMRLTRHCGAELAVIVFIFHGCSASAEKKLSAGLIRPRQTLFIRR
jgi:hypothetical protein